MNIGAGIIRVPDFKVGVADGISATVENSSAQVQNGSDCRRDVVVDDEQIVVRIQRQIRRVVRPFGLLGRCYKRFCKNARNLIERSSEAHSSQARKQSSST